MKKAKHYFILNKKSDYEKSALDNMEYDETGIWVDTKSVQKRGIFLSRVWDSREKHMEWHRLVLKLNDYSDAPYRISIYTSEEPNLCWNGEFISIQKWIQNDQISIEEKLNYLESYCRKVEIGKSDLLLHEVVGRYLWVSIEVYQQFEQELKFETMTIYFPKNSWLSYLPELYEASDTEHFLEHFLAIFQSSFDDMNLEIKRIPYRLDVETTDSEYLDFLCEWIGVTKSQMWPEEKKRALLAQAADLYKMRGTREGMRKLLSLYLGDEVFLIEKHQWKRVNMAMERKKLYETLYGSSSYIITVLVKEECVPDRKKYQTLVEVIDTLKPAQARLNLVVLKPYIFLDQHTYLGVNSTLSRYQEASLDGKSVLSFTTIGGSNRRSGEEYEEY